MIVLPTNAPYEVRFSLTTTYHWNNFDVNASEASLKKGLEVKQGPFGFGNAVVLDKSKDQVSFLQKLDKILNFTINSVSLIQILQHLMIFV